MDRPYYLHAFWDNEAKVWVASSDEVPGLATEADTGEELKLRVFQGRQGRSRNIKDRERKNYARFIRCQVWLQRSFSPLRKLGLLQRIKLQKIIMHSEGS